MLLVKIKNYRIKIKIIKNMLAYQDNPEEEVNKWLH